MTKSRQTTSIRDLRRDDTGSSGSAGGNGGSGGSKGEAGSSNEGGAPGDGGSNSDGGSTASNNPSTTQGNASASQAASNSSAADGSAASTVAVGPSSTGGGGEDPYAVERQICVDKINALRATESLPAYGRWGDAEMCSDGQATSDEQTNTPHGSFPGCGESAQNECLGQGPQGVSGCLDQMWAEKDLLECAGCSACHAQQGDCDNCFFPVCGHYVNMSKLLYSEVSCGFSSLGGWAVQNFR